MSEKKTISPIKLVFLFILTILIEQTQSQSAILSGTVKHSVTQLPVYPATISFVEDGLVYGIAKTNETGGYQLSKTLAAGPYDVIISSNSSNYYNKGVLVEIFYVDPYNYGDFITYNVLLPETILQGEILDETNNKPITNCILTAFCIYNNKVIRNLTVTIDEKGYFQASIVPDEYFIYIQFLSEADQTSYSPIYYMSYPSYWTSPTSSVQFLIPLASTIAGDVTFQSDGEIITNGTITVYPSMELNTFVPFPLISSPLSASGSFNITVQGDYYFFLSLTYDEVVGENSFHCDNLNVWSDYVTSNENYYLPPITVNDVVFNGTVYSHSQSQSSLLSLDNLNENDRLNNYSDEVTREGVDGGRVIGTLEQNYFGFNFNSFFSFLTNENGNFSIRVIGGYYNDLTLFPPTGSNLLISFLNRGMYIMDPYESQNVTLIAPSPLLLSGEIYYDDGSYLPAGSYIYASTPTLTSSTVSSDGYYKLAISEGSYDIYVIYEWISPSNSNVYFKTSSFFVGQLFYYYYYNYDLSITNGLEKRAEYNYYNDNYNLYVPKISISGTIQNTNGIPVGGVTFSGKANSYFGQFDHFSAVSDEFGHFYLELLANYYFDLSLKPPPNSNYSSTPIPSMDIYDSFTSLTLNIF